MNGAKIFSKIDLKEAYRQIQPPGGSRRFHTDEGIYRFKRLCYGINNSFEIFQKTILQNICKIENIKFI